MTPEQTDLALQYLFACIALLALAVGGGSMLLGWVVERRAPREITSSGAVSRLSDAVVSTDQTAQTPDGATQTANEDDIKAARRAMLLGVYRSMRAVPGMTREQARAILQAANLPLDNNLWVEAKPTAKEDAPPVAYTPIAGRPYDPREYFQDDPQLQYQPPAV